MSYANESMYQDHKVLHDSLSILVVALDEG